MKYNELSTTANKNRKRVGRGISAGGGKTAGRGTKGQNSRTGKKLRPTFAGGQKSLVQAIPKLKGFKSIRPKAEVVYLDHLNDMKGEVDNFYLFENSYISSPYVKVKVILRGELKTAVNLKTQAASKSAIEAVKKAGGSFTSVPIPQRTKVEEK
ncbi:MAG: 50S ribosomal protein L15 [Candidatus Nomurabacteria bacterium]|jgi:large subunit ribosomal protein L15|nr:50S ribosomal protein L15 [Candidatus Nomurabacteria bacterium]